MPPIIRPWLGRQKRDWHGQGHGYVLSWLEWWVRVLVYVDSVIIRMDDFRTIEQQGKGNHLLFFILSYVRQLRTNYQKRNMSSRQGWLRYMTCHLGRGNVSKPEEAAVSLTEHARWVAAQGWNGAPHVGEMVRMTGGVASSSFSIEGKSIYFLSLIQIHREVAAWVMTGFCAH